jgi:hypothetical protein
MSTPAWTPGTSYAHGDRVRWNGYLLECRETHFAPGLAGEPWFDAPGRRGLLLIASLKRWRVCAEEMLDEYWARIRELGGEDERHRRRQR